MGTWFESTGRGLQKEREQNEKTECLTNYLLAIVCISTLAYAQEISRLPIPSVYNVQMGRHVYYMPKSTLEFKGYDFSTKRTWSHDSYVSWKLPLVDLTYTHSPGGLSEADGAMLFSTSHRGDIELKLGQVVNPTINLEWSAMDLHTWHIAQIEKTTTDKEGKEFTELVPVMVHNRDAIQRVYGGAGLAFETPILYALTFKAAGSYRFVLTNVGGKDQLVSAGPQVKL